MSRHLLRIHRRSKGHRDYNIIFFKCKVEIQCIGNSETQKSPLTLAMNN